MFELFARPTGAFVIARRVAPSGGVVFVKPFQWFFHQLNRRGHRLLHRSLACGHLHQHLALLFFGDRTHVADLLGHILAQADPNDKGFDYYDSLMGLYEAEAGREGTVEARDWDGNPDEITEMDALVAYLQMTGTLVDFSTYEADDLSNRR